MSLWDFTFAMFDWGTDLCKRELQTEGARKLLNYPSTERFDLIITEIAWGECFFAFIHKFGSPPVIATSGVGIPPWISLTMRNPENPSYMPNFMLPFSSHMTFRERMLNFIIHNFVTLIYEYRHIRAEEAIARKYFKDFPPFWDIERNFSIVLVNTVPGVDDPRPLLPNVIPVGGMHIKDVPSPLPKVSSYDLLRSVARLTLAAFYQIQIQSKLSKDFNISLLQSHCTAHVEVVCVCLGSDAVTPEDRIDTFLINLSNHLQDYTTLNTIRPQYQP